MLFQYSLLSCFNVLNLLNNCWGSSSASSSDHSASSEDSVVERDDALKSAMSKGGEAADYYPPRRPAAQSPISRLRSSPKKAKSSPPPPQGKRRGCRVVDSGSPYSSNGMIMIQPPTGMHGKSSSKPKEAKERRPWWSTSAARIISSLPVIRRRRRAQAVAPPATTRCESVVVLEQNQQGIKDAILYCKSTLSTQTPLTPPPAGADAALPDDSIKSLTRRVDNSGHKLSPESDDDGSLFELVLDDHITNHDHEESVSETDKDDLFELVLDNRSTDSDITRRPVQESMIRTEKKCEEQILEETIQAINSAMLLFHDDCFWIEQFKELWEMFDSYHKLY